MLTLLAGTYLSPPYSAPPDLIIRVLRHCHPTYGEAYVLTFVPKFNRTTAIAML